MAFLAKSSLCLLVESHAFALEITMSMAMAQQFPCRVVTTPFSVVTSPFPQENHRKTPGSLGKNLHFSPGKITSFHPDIPLVLGTWPPMSPPPLSSGKLSCGMRWARRCKRRHSWPSPCGRWRETQRRSGDFLWFQGECDFDFRFGKQWVICMDSASKQSNRTGWWLEHEF